MILVDTHVVLWMAMEPFRISKRARAAIENARSESQAVAISDMTLLEIAMLEAKSRISLNASLETFLQEVEAQFVVLPITSRASAQIVSLPANFSKDPADRVIAATALVSGVALVTADAAIRRSRVLQTIW